MKDKKEKENKKKKEERLKNKQNVVLNRVGPCSCRA